MLDLLPGKRDQNDRSLAGHVESMSRESDSVALLRGIASQNMLRGLNQ